jgi:hypothetical protein
MSLKLSGTQLGNITGGPSSLNLYELADVSIVAPATGQYLRYNSTISEWQNSVINTEVYNFLDTHLSGSNGVVLTKLSGPQTVDIGLNITASGDATGNLTAGNIGLTLATVNAGIGTFGSATTIPIVTVNAKGLITGVSQTAFTGTSPLATSLAGGSTGELLYQSAAGVTAFLSPGTTSQVLVGSPTAPSWSNTPTLTGTNFSGIPNGALTNSSLTIGSTSISLGGTSTTLAGLTSVTSTTFSGSGAGLTSIPNGALTNSSLTIGSTSISLGGTSTTLAGLTSVTSTTFTGALSGNATTATTSTNVAGGAAGSLPYQTAASTTTTLPAGTSSQVLISGATPSWSNTPTLTGTNFSGIPNGALTNSSLTIGSTNISLGGVSGTLTGLASVTSSVFVGPISGNATTATALAVGRTFSLSTDATGTSAAFDGSGNATIPMTLATVNSSPQADTFRRITVNGKGLTTATSAVTSGDITTALGFTPVNNAGGTMTGLLILSADPTNALGAVTKQYADGISSGVNVHAACETATTAPLAACTYANGTGGVNATLTANANGPIGTIGGYSITSTGKRILVKDQASQIQNGIYDVTQLGVAGGGGSPWILTRSADFDGSPTSEVQAGDMTFVQEGSNAGTQWVQITVGTGVNVGPPTYDYVIIGTDNIVFTQFAGSGTYTAGTGINISTNTISNTGVLSNVAGTGISVSGATGNVTVTNTGVTSAVAGSNISVSAATGAVTFAVTGTVPSATNIAGGAANQIPFQSAPSTTTFNAGLTYTTGTNTLSVGTAAAGVVSAATGQTLQISSDVSVGISTNGSSRLSIASTGAFTIGGGTGTAGQVLISGGNAATPTWSSTPTITGTNFTSIPNSALTNSSLTIGSTNIALGATSTTLAGLTSVTATTFIGALSGNATTATTASSATTATTATNATQIGGTVASDVMLNRGSVLVANQNTATGNGFYSQNDGSSTSGLLVFTPGGSLGTGQIRMDYAGEMYFRNKTDSTTWTSWKTVLSSQNYNSYSPTLGGTGASGTWGINITGNSATVGGFTPSASSGVGSRVVVADASGYITNTYFYSTDNSQSSSVSAIMVKAGDNYLRSGTAQAVATFLSGSTVSSWPVYSTNNTAYAGPAGGLQPTANPSTTGATMSFLRPSAYGLNMGLDSDNVFRIGGWSAPANVLQLDMSGNLTVNGNYNVVNYGLGLTGLYDSTKYQNVFSMGASYRPSADGLSIASSYGIVWTHTNAGGQSKAGLSHQMLVTNAGVTQTAIGTGIWTHYTRRRK